MEILVHLDIYSIHSAAV